MGVLQIDFLYKLVNENIICKIFYAEIIRSHTSLVDEHTDVYRLNFLYAKMLNFFIFTFCE